jgi:hypothetical protein
LNSTKLYHNYIVYDQTSITINSLLARHDYWFTVDSFNEGGIANGANIIRSSGPYVSVVFDQGPRKLSISNGTIGPAQVKEWQSEAHIVAFGPNVGIEPGAFANFSALTTVTFTDQSSIPASAFSNCTSLRSVTFPPALTELGNQAFAGCFSLQAVDLESTKLTAISARAFFGCLGLHSLVIPTSIKSIGASAFAGCDSLGQVILTWVSSLTDIGESAFENCRKIVQLGLPPGLASIGSYAFRNCAGLRSLTIGGLISRWGDGVFAGTGGVTQLEFTGSNTSHVNCAVLNAALAPSVAIIAPHLTERTICGHAVNGTAGPTKTPPHGIHLVGWEIALIVVGAVAVVACICYVAWAKCLRRDALPPDDPLLSSTMSKGY